MKTKAFSLDRILNSEVENRIGSKEREYRDRALMKANHLTSRGIPSRQGVPQYTYIGEITGDYNSLKGEVSAILQNANLIGDDKRVQADFKDEINRTEEDLKEKEKEKGDIEIAIQETPESSTGKGVLIGVAIFLAIVSGSEALLTLLGFMLYESLIFSIPIGTGFWMCYALFAAGTAEFMKRAKSLKERLITVSLAALIALPILFIAAWLRVKNLAFEMEEVEGGEMSPFIFVGVNVFLMATAIAVDYIAVPSWKQLTQDRVRLKLERKLAKVKDEIRNLKKRLGELKSEMKEARMRLDRLATYSKQKCVEIDQLYAATVSAMMTEVTKRSGEVPECFSEPLPELIKIDFEHFNVDDE